jgi:DNA-binding GntR family transcriptional regulator
MCADSPRSGDRPGSVYELIREDIISGRLASNERVKIAELAKRFGTSTIPVREALQRLGGEGMVVLEPNRGARVRPIDADFVRDIIEIDAMIEAAMTRWFVSVATKADLAELENIQAEIEADGFADRTLHGHLDVKFHRLIYDRHYNRHAIDLWWKNRQILRAINRRLPTSLSRQAALLQEHHELIDCIRAQDADGAAAVVARHVEGGGQHMMQQMGVAQRNEHLSQENAAP